MNITHHLGRTINLLKWPCAVAGFLTLPASLLTAKNLLITIEWSEPSAFRFLSGAALYWVAWGLVFSSRSLGSLFTTFIHELTHALLAWVTFNKVRGLRLTWRSGGSVEIVGHPHWLITIAPYMFPTLSLLIWGSAWCLEAALDRPVISDLWLDVLMGMSLAYFWISLKMDLRLSQPDLKNVGPLFSLMLLPTMIIWSSAVVIALGCYGGLGLTKAWGVILKMWLGAIQQTLMWGV